MLNGSEILYNSLESAAKKFKVILQLQQVFLTSKYSIFNIFKYLIKLIRPKARQK